MANCIHCDMRPAGFEDTVYCQPCLDWQRAAYMSHMADLPSPDWDPFDPDDIEARYPTTPEGTIPEDANA